MEELYQYVEDILSGVIPCCQSALLSVQRFKRDLEDPRYYFDEKKVKKVFKFFRLLTPSTEMNTVELLNYQKFIVANIFGFYKVGETDRQGKPVRRYKKAYIELPRKSGKSLLSTGLSLYMLMADNELGPQIFAAATRSEQARVVFDEASKMVKNSDILSHLLHSTNNFIQFKANDGIFKPMSSNSKKQDGLNPSYVSVDEYHAHETSDTYDIFASGMGARTNPLIFVITTAGFNLDGPCYELRTALKSMMNGEYELDDSQFVLIYEPDEEDKEKWDDLSVWEKVNPAFHADFVNDDFALNRIKEAKMIPSSKFDVLTKNLNIWCNSPESWMDISVWRSAPNLDAHIRENLASYPCWGGIDAAIVDDINAFVLAFELPDNQIYLKPYFWIMEAKRQEMCNLVAGFESWINRGYVEVMPGDERYSPMIIEKVKECYNKYDLQYINIDRFDTTDIRSDLNRDLLRKDGSAEPFVMTFSQSITDFGPVVKGFETDVYTKRIIHDGNPVMDWMIRNVVPRYDSHMNMMPSKKVKGKGHNKKAKIDGVMASLMAYAPILSRRLEKQEGDYSVLWS